MSVRNASTKAVAPTSLDVELVAPPTDSVSRVAFSPTADILAVASWNNEARSRASLYRLRDNEAITLHFCTGSIV